ncbi:MAG: hypothetical protein WBG36_01865, partial [Ornithinimicrobium sp.]
TVISVQLHRSPTPGRHSTPPAPQRSAPGRGRPGHIRRQTGERGSRYVPVLVQIVIRPMWIVALGP